MAEEMLTLPKFEEASEIVKKVPRREDPYVEGRYCRPAAGRNS